MIASETVFVACYALVLLGVAAGLHRLGRANTSPWASRVLSGYRRQVPDPPDPAAPTDWPHSENGRLHTLVALVATWPASPC
ncbi:hypothetical protein [Nonomuraea basaltis]|uniref:hypothetical protein n=1 Tax=Nonomuraea basaltis TaxID=2495887 RepID=UPI00110C5655|nr:hypothetical protein [Nonomuraea basaltis]TMR90091.1 hypothetical protein EJK15_57140 [Nonomuraea basaltis]